MTLHWRPTCCLRCTVSLETVQQGLGNLIEKGFGGSSEPRLWWGRAWKPSVWGTHKHLQARAHHAPASGQDPRLSPASARRRTSRGLLALCTLRNLRRSDDLGHRCCCKTHSWLRLCTPTRCAWAGPRFRTMGVVWHVICKVHVNSWNLARLLFVFPWELQGSCRQFSKYVLSESLQRFRCGVWFSSAHWSQRGFCDT